MLNNNKDPSSINQTHNSLIHKCKNPSRAKYFRPISLCNVTMKVITKVITNRLKVFLVEVVDIEQSAFVKGRLITNNALVAMECFHWMNKKTKGKRGVMAIKLDMSKAYDRIEWDFIFEVLSSMGFPVNLIKLINNCITTVSYKVLINGQPSRSIFPDKGIRQGDPLSPYLFILCANAFPSLLKEAASAKEIHGIKVARAAPEITHLLFADDSLVFSRANKEEADRILNILKSYEVSSGQLVNYDKSEVSFSRNMQEEDKQMIQTRMSVKTVQNHSTYLGLPIVFGRSKKDIFARVSEKVWKKNQSLERDISVKSRKRSVDQSICPSHSYVRDELL